MLLFGEGKLQIYGAYDVGAATGACPQLALFRLVDLHEDARAHVRQLSQSPHDHGHFRSAILIGQVESDQGIEYHKDRSVLLDQTADGLKVALVIQLHAGEVSAKKRIVGTEAHFREPSFR